MAAALAAIEAVAAERRLERVRLNREYQVRLGAIADAYEHASVLPFTRYPYRDVHLIERKSNTRARGARDSFFLPLGDARVPGSASCDRDEFGGDAMGDIGRMHVVFALILDRAEFKKATNRKCEAVVLKKVAPHENIEKESANQEHAYTRSPYVGTYKPPGADDEYLIEINVVDFYFPGGELRAHLRDANGGSGYVTYNRVSQVGAFDEFYASMINDYRPMLARLRVNVVDSLAERIVLSEFTFNARAYRALYKRKRVVDAFIQREKADIVDHYGFEPKYTKGGAHEDFISKNNTTSFHYNAATRKIDVFLYDFDREDIAAADEPRLAEISDGGGGGGSGGERKRKLKAMAALLLNHQIMSQ